MRSANGYFEALAKVPLFEGMSRKDLRAVAARMTPVEVAAGREFTRQGGGGRDFFVVLEGSAIVTRDGKQVCRVTKGGFFGELALLVPHEIPAIAVTVMEQLAMLAMDVYPLPHHEPLRIDLTDHDEPARPS